MAFTFDSTVGGASANAYAAVASCNDYLSGRLDATEWTAAATATQQYAIVMATYRLETEQWVGVPTASTQALAWPRAGVPDVRYQGRIGWPGSAYALYGAPLYDSDTIPDPILHATYELALWVLKDNTVLSDTGLEAFERVAIGPIQVTPRYGQKSGALPAHVQRLLRGLRTTSEAQVPMVRG